MSTYRADRAHGARCKTRGFTLIEMLVVVALMGILAAAAQPLVEISLRRSSEAELRHSLRQIRGAIDAYKQASDAGRIARGTDRSLEDSGYPPTLEALVAGVPDASSASASAPSGSSLQDLKLRIYFLRSLPRDPFADPGVPAAQTWALRSYESPPEAPQPGRDVFDVHSMAEGNGIDGTPYRSW